ncbi:MAG: carbohydrate-binding family 9-like protein [Bdellovibrionaceae bacterium]|nr:carbohydrate-binding family 9-like protein [Pseudobdellovibrionaceae bacterium]
MIFARALTCVLMMTALHAKAETCETTSARAPLGLVFTRGTDLRQPVNVQWTLDKTNLKARFEVKTPTIHSKPVLGPGEYPYQFDVVEIFISVADPAQKNLPYYEFEVTPLGQTLQVKINDPKKKFEEGIDMGLKISTQKIAGGWTAEMTVPLENLNWNGRVSQITGNAYAILGKSPNRSFWSQFMPALPKPNFHQPQYFRPLFKCR